MNGNEKTAKEWYENNYLNSFPNDFLSWVEGFAMQLDCPQPEPPNLVSDTIDYIDYWERIGAWNTQRIIYKKLMYAVKAERDRQKLQ